MPSVSFVYPNVAVLNRGGRGGLVKRWNWAQELECEYIEVPAHFIREKETGTDNLNEGNFLTEKAIKQLYDKDSPQGVKYILHTEPSFKSIAKLDWYNGEWREKFIDMVISISNFFGVPAAIIEIHPGKENHPCDIVESIKLLLNRYNNKFEEFNAEPLILIENRTGQVIQRGEEIRNFWNFVSKNHPYLKSKVGIVLDFSQLYTTAKNYARAKIKKKESSQILSLAKENFLKELEIIFNLPEEVLKGFHIHYQHS